MEGCVCGEHIQMTMNSKTALYCLVFKVQTIFSWVLLFHAVTFILQLLTGMQYCSSDCGTLAQTENMSEI